MAAVLGSTPMSHAQSNGDDAETLIQLNEIIIAFANEEYETAKTAIERVLARDADNAAALYYLGLISLDEGLTLANRAKVEPDAQQRAAIRAEAVASFRRAQTNLQKVMRLADPTLAPVEAALDLGIAQLASDAEDNEKIAEKLASQAVLTLERYVGADAGKVDPVGHFFLAVAYYRLQALQPSRRSEIVGKGFAALDEADRLLGERPADPDEPDVKRTTFETRVLYYRGLFELARDRKQAGRGFLNQVVEKDPGSDPANNAAKIIEFIDQSRADSPAAISFDSPIGPLQFDGSLTIGGFYDTNVILLGEDTILPRGIEQADDIRGGVEASFDVTRQLTQEDGILGRSLLFGLGGSTVHFWQPSIGEFDVNTYSGRAYVNWEPVANLYLGVQYDYTFTQLGHDPFISSNRISPVISKLWMRQGDYGEEEFARTDLYYSYDRRDYFDILTDRRFDRDGNYHAIGLTQSFNLMRAEALWPEYYGADGPGASEGTDGRRWMSVAGGYLFRNERTNGEEFDLSGNAVFAGINIPLPWRLDFNLRGEWGWDDYSERSAFDFEGKERFDFIQRYEAGLARTLIDQGEYAPIPTLDMRVRGGIEYTLQDSNIWDRLGQDIYSFDRTIYSLKLIINF